MLTRRTRAALLLVLVCHGCALLARYAYQAETRVEQNVAAVAFSESDLQRAEAVTSKVAETCRLRSGEEVYGSLDGENLISAMHKPPREFLMVFARKVRPAELSISLRLEVSEDRRTLYFIASDPESGTPSNFLDCLRDGLKATVNREFQGMSIVHEEKVIGPIYTHP